MSGASAVTYRFEMKWNLVDAITGAQPVTLQWLRAPHNGHRIPFPRLVLLGLYKASGGDFRVGMYFNVTVLAAAAAILMWASKRNRGKTSVADAVFPMLLLHWGHYENLLWSWQSRKWCRLPSSGACLR